MLFASPAPAAFAGLSALQPRYSVERPSTEEQYFLALAKEHERAATLARQRMEEARRRQQQQRELEAQLRLQQELATVLQVRAPQRSPYHTPARASFGRTVPLADDVIFGFDARDNDAYDAYAERMHRRSRAAMIERQKRAEEQSLLRALFQEQRRAQAERVAAELQLQLQRAQEVKAEQERRRKAQQEAEKEQARRHLASRAADEENLRQFFEALVGAMGAASSESQGADLERQNAIRRNSAPAASQEKKTPAPTRKSAPATPAPERPASSIPAKRPASPTPSVASDASDASLNSIALLQDKYNTLRSSFSFPTTLAFAAPSSSTPGSAPILLYNPANAPIHAYENALTNLLTELDAVESFGDAHVREVRRSLVKNVEAELEALEERKREAWREQQIVVESPAPVESVPVVVESAPVEPASVVEPTLVLESAPVVESAPVESVAPAAESGSTEPTSAIDSPIRLAWLATRLSQPSESEDDEVKAVRENLLACLTETAPEITLTEPATELLSLDVVESPSEPEAVPFEPVSEPALESPTVESVPEPEVVDTHSSTPLTEAPVVEAPAAEVPTTETATTEPETVGESTPATEPEVTLTTLVESVPESDATSVTTSSEPEVVAQHEAQSEPESESSVLAQPEPESLAQSPEPFSVPAPAPAPAHHEHSTFVQVFPESDSDVDTDADLASELADRRSVSGEEFELL